MQQGGGNYTRKQCRFIKAGFNAVGTYHNNQKQCVPVNIEVLAKGRGVILVQLVRNNISD